jgi:hypothetical protein
VDSLLVSRAAVLEALQRPIDPRHFKTRRQGAKELTYVPWSTLVRCLQHRAPGYSWELKAVAQVGDWVTVTGRLSITTADGPLVYENVSSESLKTTSHAPPVECAASACLRRCCAMAGLGLELWELDL